MHESLLDEVQSANLVEELTTVLLKHLKEAAHDRESKSTGCKRLTTEQAAEYIGLIPGTLCQWRMCRDVKCPRYVKAGRHVYYPRKDLDEWLSRWHVDNSRPANSPHRFKRKIDLIPWDDLMGTYIRMMEELEKEGRPDATWELWRWRERMQEVE